MSIKINEITHPDYDRFLNKWTKYRFVFTGGWDFINKYLIRYSNREDRTDFENRVKISYSPSHAKAAVVDIKNAIYQRLVDVKRIGGSSSYTSAIGGGGKGVDLEGNSMTSYIGRSILPELLSIGRVGVLVDRPILDSGTRTKNRNRRARPYLQTYHAEDIRSWAFDQENNLISLLLRSSTDLIDEDTGLISGDNEEFRLYKLVEEGVVVRRYNKDGENIGEDMLMNIPRIPFVWFWINQSLLTDVAEYQIGMLNLASTDMHYALKSNFPFYVEQFDRLSDTGLLRQSVTPVPSLLADDSGANIPDGVAKQGQAADATIANTPEIQVGVTQGRRYGKGLNQPDFIHPSAEPLRVSMEKQERMKEEIRQLVNLSLSNVRPMRQSAESKDFDNQGLEAGLSYIGLELEYGENEIAKIWEMFEKSSKEATIKYPTNYSIRSEAERRLEARELGDLMPRIPSLIFQKALAKQIVQVTLGTRLDPEELRKIEKEIDSAKVVVNDPEVIVADLEAGLVSTATASVARGYPKDEVEKAKADHAERLARIQEAQTKKEDLSGRGVDQDLDDKKSEIEKEGKEGRGEAQ